MKLERIWAREYANGVHFSAVKKDGFTAYVPESLALAMFLRAQLELLGVELNTPDEELEKFLTTERPRPRRRQNNKRKRKS